MIPLIRKIRMLVQSPMDFILGLLAVPSAFVLLKFRTIGAHNLKFTREILRRIGVFPIMDHYYEPLFQPKYLTRKLSDDRLLPGLDLRSPEQLQLLSQMEKSNELIDLDLQRKDDTQAFCIDNDSFVAGDAEFLYQFIRMTKPRRIVEIGCGNSTKIARLAIQKNHAESGKEAAHICIEPYEMPWLESIGVEVIREKAENCPLEIFQELAAGDLLFIDSTHIIRPQGDVLFEYLTVIPSLKSGVNVHIHDIFTPKDYPEMWIIEAVAFWNEQYLLEALISNSSRYKVVAALNFLKHHYYADLKRVCPYLKPDTEPGSFYFHT